MFSQENQLRLWIVTGIAVGAIVYFYKQDKAKKQKAAQLALQKTLAVPLALFKAGEEGNLDAVMAELSKEQVGKGFVLWQKNVNNILFKNATSTPLFDASSYGLVDIVKLLLADKDIKVNQTETTSGVTPLYIAAQNGNVNIVNALLAKEGILVNELSSGETPLLVATLYSSRTEGHREVVRSLLKVKGINTNLGSMRGSDGNITRMTPLFLASQNNDLEIDINYKDNHAIDLNAKTKCGNTALCYACFKGHADVVKILMKNR